MDIAQLEQGKKLDEHIKAWRSLKDHFNQRTIDDPVDEVKKLVSQQEYRNLVSINRIDIANVMLDAFKKKVDEEIELLEKQFEEL